MRTEEYTENGHVPYLPHVSRLTCLRRNSGARAARAGKQAAVTTVRARSRLASHPAIWRCRGSECGGGTRVSAQVWRIEHNQPVLFTTTPSQCSGQLEIADARRKSLKEASLSVISSMSVDRTAADTQGAERLQDERDGNP